MPRIPLSLIRKAHSVSPHAAALLPACRDLSSALTELRWIREHIRSTRSSSPEEARLVRLCQRRGKGVPLQYVLGTQPFGQLDLKCRPGVLIPRPEPEAYSAHLAQLIKTGYFGSQPHCLNIVDFCSGTGCIALLLFALLQSSFRNLNVRGIDVSRRAVDLSWENLQHNISTGRMSAPTTPGQTVRFKQGNIFSPDWQKALCLAPSSSSFPSSAGGDGVWDIMVSNPPYISARGFARDTARSVRNYEPKLAQVPQIPRAATDLHGRVRQEECAPEDVFYARLLEIAGSMRPKIILFEVGDEVQARRVVEMALQGRSRLNGYTIETWRDWPEGVPEEDESTPMGVDAEVGSIYVKGAGHVRSVVMIRNK